MAKLVYHKARKQWRKKKRIDGKDKYFYLGDSGVNKSDRAAYNKAMTEWGEIETNLALAETARAEAAEHGRLQKAFPREYIAALVSRQQHADGIDTEACDALTRVSLRKCGLLGKPGFELASDPLIETERSIDFWITKYLNAFRAQVDLGQRSITRHESIRVHLSKLADFKFNGQRSGNIDIREINAGFLSDYHASLASQVGNKELSTYTARDILTIAKQFVRYLWEQEQITLPRNINSKMLNISVTASEIKTVDAAVIRKLLAISSERTRLYLLLSLNCGMTQKDIADLTKKEVNYTQGTIKRKRSKTHKHENVPTVTYKLWPETLALLKKYNTDKNNRLAVTNIDGKPLLVEGINDKGVLTKTDNVKSAFRRLVIKHNNNNLKEGESKINITFKQLRSTGATLLDHNPDFKTVSSLWLGHAPTSVKDKHYASGDMVLLAKGTDWLREQFL